MLLLALVQRMGAQSGQRPHGTVSPSTSTRHGASHVPPASVHPAPPSVPSPARPRPSPVPPRSLTPGASPRLEPASPFDAGPFTYAPRYRPWQRPRPPRYWRSGYYGYGAPYELVEAPPIGERHESSSDQLSIDGTLFLEVEPRAADVYVDGFYVGTADDFSLNGLPLRVGRHWIDLRAAGYDTLTVPVNITVEHSVRYRGGLTLASTAAASTEPARSPQTMYVINGCYAGNRPPVVSGLPSGCDISRLRVLTDPR